jgi:hypothetical protein
MGQTVKFSDDNVKLVNLPDMGWIAGAGAHSFIEIMKDKLQNSLITSNEQVKQLFLESYREVEKLNIYDKDTLDVTGIAASWIGFNPEVSVLPLFRVGIFSDKTVSDEIAAPMLEKDMIYLLYPYEYMIDKEKVNTFEVKFPLKYIFDGDYNTFIYKISCMFKEISSNSKSVSSVCDIGIMTIDNNGIHKIQVKEDVDHLIDDYKNDYKNTHFELVWSTQNED